MGLRISRMGVDMNLYARDDLRYFGRHNVDVGPVASGGRPALKGLWVNGQRVVEDDVLRAEARGARVGQRLAGSGATSPRISGSTEYAPTKGYAAERIDALQD